MTMSRRGSWYKTRVTIAVASCAVMLFPLYWMVAVSFTSSREVRSGSLRLWPSDPTLDNFQQVFDRFPVWTWFGNSAAIAVVVTLINPGRRLRCSASPGAVARCPDLARSRPAAGRPHRRPGEPCARRGSDVRGRHPSRGDGSLRHRLTGPMRQDRRRDPTPVRPGTAPRWPLPECSLALACTIPVPCRCN